MTREQRHDDERFPSELDWLDGEPPHVSSDFVERTARSVIDDRAEIASEAALANAEPLPRALLDALETPAPSEDFVERTMAALRSEHALDASLSHHDVPGPTPGFVEQTLARVTGKSSAPTARSDATDERQDFAEAHPVPTPTPDFVARTLAALREGRVIDNSRAADGRPATNVIPFWRRRVTAAAAAVLIAAGVLWGAGWLTPTDAATIVPSAAASYSPTPFGTALASLATSDSSFRPSDAIVTTAAFHQGSR